MLKTQASQLSLNPRKSSKLYFIKPHRSEILIGWFLYKCRHKEKNNGLFPVPETIRCGS